MPPTSFLLGLEVALLVSRFLQPLLFRISAPDPVTYLGVGLAMLGAAAVAYAIPARRAGRADPNSVLRAE